MNTIHISSLLPLLEEAGISSDQAAIVLDLAEAYQEPVPIIDVLDYGELVRTAYKLGQDEGFNRGREIGRCEYFEGDLDNSYEDGYKAGSEFVMKKYQEQIDKLQELLKERNNHE